MKKELTKKELNKISGGEANINKTQYYALLNDYKLAQENLIIAKLGDIISPGVLLKAQIEFKKAEAKLIDFEKAIASDKS